VRALRVLPRSAWPQREAAIREEYRKLYRTTWNRAPVQRALAQASNLMIWDDHDVADDFGDRTDVTQPHSAEHFVASCGWRVFHEYQRQLWDGGAERVPVGAEEGFWCRWGPIAALFLDVRGSRGFRAFDREQPEVPQPFLSPAQ
jgi:phosphodiesterase/alkaline phosphatase D-like protein